MDDNKKEKKEKFSKEVDDAINGYAIGVSFLSIGIFLLLKPNYFYLPIISYILGAVIGLFGFFGTGLELSKNSKIKGFDNLIGGISLLIVWIITYIKISALWANIVFFVLLVLGAYATCLGLFQGIYSIFQNIKNRKSEEKSKTSIINQIVLFLTQLCGLAVAIFNVLKAINIIE